MLRIKNVSGSSFEKYGSVLTDVPRADLIRAAEAIPMPEDGVSYERSIQSLEDTEDFKSLERWFGGEQKLECGLCWGYNKKMDAMEYHRSSEVNIAVTDLILILGDRRDIVNDQFDSSKAEVFMVPQGKVIELYATTLHYAPCQNTSKGFKAIVLLPDGTNRDLTEETKRMAMTANGEKRMLFAQNKWLLCHKDCSAVADGAYVGITGENLTTA